MAEHSPQILAGKEKATTSINKGLFIIKNCLMPLQASIKPIHTKGWLAATTSTIEACSYSGRFLCPHKHQQSQLIFKDGFTPLHCTVPSLPL